MSSPEQLIAEAEAIRERIRPPPTLLGFNMNIDWIVRTWELETPIMTILRRLIDDGVLPRQAEKIFIEGFTQGIAREIVFPNRIDVTHIAGYGLTGVSRIGGQVGLMATYASKLFPAWKVYALRPGSINDCRDVEIELPNVRWIPFHAEGLQSVPVHVVLEFRKGQVIETESGKVVCPRDNRVILSSEPKKVNIHELVELVLTVLDQHDEISSLIVAGIHLPWLENALSGIVKTIKTDKIDSFIHVEVTHFESENDKNKQLWHNVDSIGFNEQEAFLVARRTRTGITSMDRAFQQNVEVIAQMYPQLRLHGHTKGLYALRDSCAPAKQKEEMLMSSAIALIVAGQYYESASVKWNQVAKGEFLPIDWNSEVSFFKVPTITNPVFTVGLGDAISIAGLACHLS